MDVDKTNPVYWRVEGSLLNVSTVRPVAFFAWNAQTFTERWLRRGGIFLQAVLRPLLYASDRVFATRVVYSILRGISRDRLDLLGEEYAQYVLKPRLKPKGVESLKAALARGQKVILVSHGLDHIVRPLAAQLGVDRVIANRLEFRDGYATGRLLDPVIRPRGGFARLTGGKPDGSRTFEQLVGELGLERCPELLREASIPAHRVSAVLQSRSGLQTSDSPQRLSVRESLAGKRILLIGVTGFIGKVWLAQTLERLPEIGRIYLLVRRQKSTSAQRRFERIVEESPLFDPLHAQYGEGFARLLADKVEVVEGDASRRDFGLPPDLLNRVRAEVDVVINSSGLTDFNPDLRDAIAANVDAVINVVDFVRNCQHAGLLHLSTCYVAGARDGRVPEELRPNYVPCGMPDFDAERELQSLRETIARAERYAESAELGEELLKRARNRKSAAKDLHGAALDNQVRKNRIRWLKNHLTQAGTRRARELGWPNTYTFTKSLAESLIARHIGNAPLAVVRPAIVETSIAEPFRGWNEGINTSASLSYLLGTYFRQLPSNARKRLDIVPVDTVCRGITLVAAAIVAGVNERLYQLATSVSNPCDMARSIELTCLAHRKFYRAQNGLEHQFKMRFDTIPVSKERYNRLSAPAQKAVIKSLQKITAPFPFLQPPLVRTERGLERVEKLIELFEPFILHNEHDFEAENIEKLSHALPADERSAFAYDTRSLDWYEYWINIHIPALRKWTYPLIEGRPIEVRAQRNLQLHSAEPARLAGRAASDPKNGPGDTLKTGTGATWRYS